MPPQTPATSYALPSVQAPVLKVKTHVKAGAIAANHNATLVKAAPQGLQVKTRVKAGAIAVNHSATLVRVKGQTKGLKVKSHIKAGAGLPTIPIPPL